jgi:uncharacterized membrane protein HdeD (DUF308 family)
MEAFVLFLLVLFAMINLAVMLGVALTMVKIFEMIKNQEERHQMEEEVKRKARGLLDINTPQMPYNLRDRN